MSDANIANIILPVIVPVVSFITPFLVWYTSWKKLSVDFKQQRVADLSLIDKIDIKSEDHIVRLKNSLYFSQVFNLEIPIHYMNLILTCSDPAMAIRVYKESRSSMQFTETEITKDNTFDSFFSFLKIILIVLGIVFITVELFLYVSFYSQKPGINQSIYAILIFASLVIFYFLINFFSREFDKALNARRFLKNQEEYKKAQQEK